MKKLQLIDLCTQLMWRDAAGITRNDAAGITRNHRECYENIELSISEYSASVFVKVQTSKIAK